MSHRQGISNWCLVGVSDVAKQRIVSLRFGSNFVGRRRKDQVRLMSTLCSREHCRLDIADHNNIRLMDNSSNGTYVNGIQYKLQRLPLQIGDLIGFGTPTHADYYEDTQRYVYRVEQRDDTIADTIDLVSDDEKPEMVEIDDSDSDSSDSSNIDEKHTIDANEYMQTQLPQVDPEVMRRVENLQKRKKELAAAKLIDAKPLKKRRKTILQEDYVWQDGLQTKRAANDLPGMMATTVPIAEQRAARLAEIGVKERLAREEAERIEAAKRVRAVPKVKRTLVTRNERLAEEMLRNQQ